ncbi:MAG: hypothetical protein IJ198_14790 [Lachnospiraceae bacterium]|nr:hypothetical protein [Lachnospiraceae bacterium]
MNYYRPINSGEGDLYLDAGYDCPSPFEKIRYCDCGVITFLDGPCRGCGKKTMKPITRTLKDQFYKEMKQESRYQMTLLIMSTVLAVLYLVVMMVIIGNSSSYGLKMGRMVFMIVVAVLVISLCILSVFELIGSKRAVHQVRTYKFGKQVIEAFELAYGISPFKAKDGSGEKETWFKAFLAQYLEDINYLYGKFAEAVKSERKEEQIQEVYHEALKLSYVLDNQALAELRLRCLGEIGLRQNSHCDIEQILHVLRAEYFRKKPEMMYIVEKCLDSYSEPLSNWTVCCLMHDLKHFLPDTEGHLKLEQKELAKKCLVHCSGGKVMWFISRNTGSEWQMLKNCFMQARAQNKVFDLQAQAEM